MPLSVSTVPEGTGEGSVPGAEGEEQTEVGARARPDENTAALGPESSNPSPSQSPSLKGGRDVAPAAAPGAPGAGVVPEFGIPGTRIGAKMSDLGIGIPAGAPGRRARNPEALRTSVMQSVAPPAPIAGGTGAAVGSRVTVPSPAGSSPAGALLGVPGARVSPPAPFRQVGKSRESVREPGSPFVTPPPAPDAASSKTAQDGAAQLPPWELVPDTGLKKRPDKPLPKPVAELSPPHEPEPEIVITPDIPEPPSVREQAAPVGDETVLELEEPIAELELEPEAPSLPLEPEIPLESRKTWASAIRRAVISSAAPSPPVEDETDHPPQRLYIITEEGVDSPVPGDDDFDEHQRVVNISAPAPTPGAGRPASVGEEGSLPAPSGSNAVLYGMLVVVVVALAAGAWFLMGSGGTGQGRAGTDAAPADPQAIESGNAGAGPGGSAVAGATPAVSVPQPTPEPTVIKIGPAASTQATAGSADQAAADTAAVEKAAAEKAAAEKAASEKAAAEKAAAEKAASEKLALERAATEKAAAQKVAELKAADQKAATATSRPTPAATDRPASSTPAAKPAADKNAAKGAEKAAAKPSPTPATAAPPPAVQDDSPVRVVFMSNAIGAEIYVDGQLKGKIPTAILLSPGSHEVKVVSKDKGEQVRSIQVKASADNASRVEKFPF